MRVICVTPFSAHTSKDKPRPEVGDEDTVIGGHNIMGVHFYKLGRFDNGFSYQADHFATLPDQTADEIESETKESIVPCPTY